MHTADVTPIQTLVIDRLAELDLSYREAAARAGGLISHGHINQVALGRATPPYSKQALDGLSLALDLPRSVVEETANRSIPQSGKTEFKLPKAAANLTPKQRKAVLAFVDALLANEK